MGKEKEDLQGVHGEHKDSDGNSLSEGEGGDSSALSPAIQSTPVENENHADLMSQVDIDIDNTEENTQDKKKPSKTVERKLITQRNLEEKKKKKDDKEEKSNDSKSEKTQKKEKKSEKTEEAADPDAEEVLETPEDIKEFVLTFKKNCIFLIRNTGIFQGFEAILTGVRFNISKLDNFLVFAADMFNVEHYLFTEKIQSSLRFGQALEPFDEDELKEYLYGFYDY
jgi:hypothetical protein